MAREDHDEAFVEICAALEQLSERLADIAIAELESAIERGEKARPPVERQATRARAALARAASILSARHDEQGDSDD